jgi:DNA-binding CsgD family transcriptional regulator
MSSILERASRRYQAHMEKKLNPASAPSLLVRVLFRVFEAMSCSGIFLDSDKRIVHMSERAQTLFGSYFSLKNGRLCTQDRVCDVLFQTMLDQHLKYGEVNKRWPRQALGIKQGDRRPLIVRAVPIDPAARAEIDGAALALLLIVPEDCPEPSDAILQQVFGMTRAESRIATRLLCGESLREIASETGVAIGTVRSQMKALFAKTSTKRQAELVALLTRIAMISEHD